jgi:hypothetical protein
MTTLRMEFSSAGVEPMAKFSFQSRAVLIVTRDIANAMYLHNCIVRTGGRSFAAYCAEQALAIAEIEAVAEVLIDFAFNDAELLATALAAREIPCLIFAGRGALKVEMANAVLKKFVGANAIMQGAFPA